LGIGRRLEISRKGDWLWPKNAAHRRSPDSGEDKIFRWLTTSHNEEVDFVCELDDFVELSIVVCTAVVAAAALSATMHQIRGAK